jgi:tetratricopeptide (TPR) repeat protein
MRRAVLAGALVVLIGAEPAASRGPAAAGPDLSAMERAIAAEPENLRLAADYRQLAIAAATFDRPIDFLEKLAKRKDSGPNIHLSLALAYVDKVPTSGDIRRLYLGRDAMGELTKAIDRQPSALAYYVRGVINLFYNNFIFKRIPRGIEDLKRALELTSPATPPLLVARIFASLGDGYWRLEDRPAAIEVWKSGAARFPGSAELQRRLDTDAGKVRWVVTDALDASTRVDTTLRGVLPE